RYAERLAREKQQQEQQRLDRAGDLRLPPAPSDDEVMRLAHRDPVAALALLEDFSRAWWKTVGRLLDEKAHELLDRGEYGDPNDYCRPVGELEVECDLPQEAEEDAEEWLQELRPDLCAEHSRITSLAVDVAHFTPSPSRVRAVAEDSGFSWQLRLGLA